jgi:acyl carrier protein
MAFSKEGRTMLGRLWFILLEGAVALLVRMSGPHGISQDELRQRVPVPDDELVPRFFPDTGMSPEVPIRIRMLFAEWLGYPVDRLLPDDDFAFILDDLDAAPLIEELERLFGIIISEADAEATLPSIRSVSELVHRLRVAQHLMGGRFLTSEEVRQWSKKWGRSEATAPAQGLTEVKCTDPVRSDCR